MIFEKHLQTDLYLTHMYLLTVKNLFLSICLLFSKHKYLIILKKH